MLPRELTGTTARLWELHCFTGVERLLPEVEVSHQCSREPGVSYVDSTGGGREPCCFCSLWTCTWPRRLRVGPPILDHVRSGSGDRPKWWHSGLQSSLSLSPLRASPTHTTSSCLVMTIMAFPLNCIIYIYPLG